MQSKYRPGPDGRKVCHEGFKCSQTTLFSPPINCVAVRIDGDKVQVRDTKDGTDATLTFAHDEWSAFIKGVKDREFELP